MTLTATWRERAFRPHDDLLQRVKWLFVLFNCLLAAISPLDLTHPEGPRGRAAGVALVAAIGLGAWSVAYFRRGRPGLLMDSVPVVLLFTYGVAAGGGTWMFARMYVVVFLVSLYGPQRRRHLALAATYLVMYQVTDIVAGVPVLPVSVISEAISLLVVIGIMQTLAAAVTRHGRFAQRDALLTEVVAGLLGERDPDRINTVVADAALRLVDVPGALVTIWRSDGDALHRVGLAGRETYPILHADITGVPQEFRAIYEQGRPAYLDADQMNQLHAYYGIEEKFVSSIVAPMRRDNEPTGLLIVGSLQPLDPDLLPVLERFAHEATLAQQLAEREALLTGLVENSSDVIAVVDDAGTLTYVSPAITATTGADANDVVGRHVGSMLRHAATGDPIAGPDEFPRRTPMPLCMGSVSSPLDVEVTANPMPDGTTILNIRDVSDRRRLEAEIEYRAFHDDITGLPNRSLLLDRLDHALRRRERSGGLLAVALIDIDDFKGVNDSLGHAAGDVLLRHTGARLTQALRDVDTAARIGGDEFALVLEGFDHTEQITMVIDRVLDALRQPISLEGREISISASVGLTVTDCAAEPDELMRNADAAMYAAKKSGKNRCATFEPNMHAQGANRLELRTELEAALRGEQFVLHYQPIMALDSAAVAGFEALVRWNHPTRGLVPPLDFVPLAEETGLIAPLGRWILHEACREASEWHVTAGTTVGLSINLSAVQLRSRDVIADVANALAAAKLDPSRLTLEVTETALMGDTEAVAAVLAGLKALGVRIAIDDFGTGYSSFAHLQSLPIDVIKVDRSFVSVVGEGPEQAAYAKAIVNIAQTLGLETVAEGVEAQSQSLLLQEWGCAFAQGWLWHAALPAAEAARLVAEGVRVAVAAPV